jgi:hypothetical protein
MPSRLLLKKVLKQVAQKSRKREERKGEIRNNERKIQ